MRRDRTRKVKLTITWLPKNKVRVTSSVKLKSDIQLRKGAKILTKGSISAKTTTLKLKKIPGKLTSALLWTLGKKTITLTAAAPLAKVAKKRSSHAVASRARRRPRRCSSIGSPKAALSVAGVSAVGNRPLRHARALAQEERVRGAGRDVLDVVDDRHRRQSRLVGRQPLERADHGLAARQVEARRGLVEQQQGRLVHERARDEHAPPLALGERGEALSLATSAAEALEQRRLHARGRRG